MTRPDIKVHGADELGRDLDKLGRFDSELKEIDRKQASKLSAQIRAAAHSEGSTAAHVAPSIKAAGPKVEVGGPGWPMAGGAAFGSSIYPQFKPRGAPRFFVPTMKKAEAKAETDYGNELDQTLRKANLT